MTLESPEFINAVRELVAFVTAVVTSPVDALVDIEPSNETTASFNNVIAPLSASYRILVRNSSRAAAVTLIMSESVLPDTSRAPSRATTFEFSIDISESTESSMLDSKASRAPAVAVIMKSESIRVRPASNSTSLVFSTAYPLSTEAIISVRNASRALPVTVTMKSESIN